MVTRLLSWLEYHDSHLLKAFTTSTKTVHPRAADTWGEIEAREFVFNAFQQYGYFPRTQEFISCYCGNSAINSTELSHMLPIYDVDA